MWGGRHCREGKGSKAEMLWTCSKDRLWITSQRHGMKRLEDVVDIAEKVREARLKCYGQVVRIDYG